MDTLTLQRSNLMLGITRLARRSIGVVTLMQVCALCRNLLLFK